MEQYSRYVELLASEYLENLIETFNILKLALSLKKYIVVSFTKGSKYVNCCEGSLLNKFILGLRNKMAT